MGMQFVQGDGTLVMSGGKVVKNVAGFGLHKLHVGAPRYAGSDRNGDVQGVSLAQSGSVSHFHV